MGWLAGKGGGRARVLLLILFGLFARAAFALDVGRWVPWRASNSWPACIESWGMQWNHCGGQTDKQTRESCYSRAIVSCAEWIDWEHVRQEEES